MKITLELNPENQNADLLIRMGYALENGNELCRDYEAAFQLYQAAASMPDGEIAENNLAWMYLNGLGVEADVHEAIRLFEDAAERGSNVAMVNLGHIYERGLSAEEPDYKLALYWYRQAAETGDNTGRFNLANMYHHGWGTRRNYQKAYEIFSDLYRQGYSGVAFYMGLYYQNGYAVEQDYSKAYCYYLEGARAQDDAFCLNQLGGMYAQGHGVEKDLVAAMAYYRQAADLGDALSMANIGYCYETGQGVEVNMEEALRWYRMAAGYGDSHAIAALQRLGVEQE